MLAATAMAAQSQVVSEPWTQIGGQGVIGAVLAFFMWFISKKHDEFVKVQRESNEAQERMSRAISQASKAQMIQTAALTNLDDGMKRMALELKAQIEADEEAEKNARPDR